MRTVAICGAAVLFSLAIAAPSYPNGTAAPVRRIAVPVPSAGSITVVELKLRTKLKKKQKNVPLARLKAVKKGSGSLVLAGVDRTRTKGVFNAVVVVFPNRSLDATRGTGRRAAPSVLIETTSAQTSVTARQIELLPLTGRNFGDLTLIQPQALGPSIDSENVLDGQLPPDDLGGGVEDALIQAIEIADGEESTYGASGIAGVIDVVTRERMSEFVGAPACWGGLEALPPSADRRSVEFAFDCTPSEPGGISSIAVQLPDMFRITRPLHDPAGALFYSINGSVIGWSWGTMPAPLRTKLTGDFELTPSVRISDARLAVGFRSPTGFRAEQFDLQIGRLGPF